MALERSFKTYFKKNKGEKGNICLDLGRDNLYEITRVRYVSQTDSNFIIPGNQYRLEYWDNSYFYSKTIYKCVYKRHCP